MPLKLTTYYRGSEIPDFPGTNTFHSKELFQIYEETPGYTPLLIMASEDGKPIARLLAAIRKSIRMFPPSLIKRCEVYGTGEYLTAEADKEKIFGEMLEHLTTEVLRSSFLIEFRNLENAMFGYKYFRSNKYFPVNWLRVRNSLHGTESAEQRFSPSRIRQIKKGLKNGASVDEAHTIEEIREFSNMLRHLYSSRIRKHFPNIIFFQHMDTRLIHSKQGKIFIGPLQRKNHRRICLYLFRQRCLPVVLGRYAENLCSAIPGYTGCMESFTRRTSKRVPSHGIHGCRTPLQETRLPRLRTPLRRQTKQYPTLVPLPLAVAEQSADQNICLKIKHPLGLKPKKNWLETNNAYLLK